MGFLVIVYQAKKCFPWFLLNKHESTYLTVKFINLQGYTKNSTFKLKDVFHI